MSGLAAQQWDSFAQVDTKVVARRLQPQSLRVEVLRESRADGNSCCTNCDKAHLTFRNVRKEYVRKKDVRNIRKRVARWSCGEKDVLLVPDTGKSENQCGT